MFKLIGSWIDNPTLKSIDDLWSNYDSTTNVVGICSKKYGYTLAELTEARVGPKTKPICLLGVVSATPNFGQSIQAMISEIGYNGDTLEICVGDKFMIFAIEY